MSGEAIFLHCGMRTGGTALAFAFREEGNFTLFYDPFSESFELKNNFLELKTNDWDSNHPKDNFYFSEYREVLDIVALYKAPKYRFDFFGKEFAKSEIREFFSQLIEFATTKNKIPVFKMETSEGRIELFSKLFPKSIHIGLTRDDLDLKNSWLEQFGLGNPYFFEVASKIVNKDPGKFGFTDKVSFPMSDQEQIETLFVMYEKTRQKLLKKCDLVIDITKVGSISEVERLIQDRIKFQAPLKLKEAYENQEKLHNTTKAKVTKLTKLLVGMRIETEQARAETEQARAETERALSSLETILSSRIWRFTSLYRLIRVRMRGKYKNGNSEIS